MGRRLKPVPWNTPIPFGDTRDGTIKFPPYLHALFGGETNGGKTTCLRVLLTGFAQREHTQFVLIDPKMVEFPKWLWGPRAACIASGPGAAKPILRLVQKDMMRRYQRVLDKQQFEHVPTEDDPRLIVLIDELAEIMLGPDGPEVEQILQSILAMGRAAGIQMLDATQQPDHKVVPTRLRNNHIQRICFGTGSREHTKMILGDDAGQIRCDRIPESEPGRGWFRSNRKFTEFRSYFMSKEEVASVIEATAHLRRPIEGFPDDLVRIECQKASK